MQIYDAAQLRDCEAGIFDDFSQCQVLAIDNLDLLAGHEPWEAACYQLVNRCRNGEFRFLFSLKRRPADVAFRLDDLRSRLQWGLMLQLPAGSEAELGEILQQRAQRLGIRLTPEVINYLLTHYARNPATQMAILRRLDSASLSHQRRITIPLIKQAMAESAD